MPSLAVCMCVSSRMLVCVRVCISNSHLSFEHGTLCLSLSDTAHADSKAEHVVRLHVRIQGCACFAADDVVPSRLPMPAWPCTSTESLTARLLLLAVSDCLPRCTVPTAARCSAAAASTLLEAASACVYLHSLRFLLLLSPSVSACLPACLPASLLSLHLQLS